ncbi:aminopeptidase P family protein [Clostridium sp. D2Q-11]|uniref:Aminopeptidase P family protein n=1 Tax=Anaeromonas frigoriresistens TaxID=2683708 RepID=A0A942Z6A5_9FIRM|nr:Xaa-Pro peptidase family protein [Anaeromonas frigoriresistens]MBS4537367.1 aminopeptidase P family protein [Anaeromonas frigoriresistens]
MKSNRLNKVLKSMKDNNLNQLIISDPASIFYLAGEWIHPGERMLALYLNTKGGHKLFVNKLFPIREDLGVEIVSFDDTDDCVKILSESLMNDQTVGIDKNWPSSFLIRLMELNGARAYVNGSFIVDRARMIKDSEEIELMRNTSRLNDMAIEKLKEAVLEGYTEKDMTQVLLSIYKEIGAEGFSFNPIIAYGPNAANPHHENGLSTPKKGDSIILDIGCVKDSYCSDMTRTVFFKEVDEKSKEVFNIVLEANKKAIAKVKPGVRFCDIDLAARDYIESMGYGEYFTHRTGHSIGIEVHDFGDVSSVNTDVLEPGMIFSIEPGIYIPGKVGVRIEDLVLVTEDGCEVLNKANKELEIIG